MKKIIGYGIFVALFLIFYIPLGLIIGFIPISGVILISAIFTELIVLAIKLTKD